MNETTLKRTVLIIACLSSFIVPFIGSSVNIALPTIGKEFKIDAVTLGWVPSSYLLASAMFLLPFGRVSDIFGRKKIFLAGTVIYTIGSLFSALSFSAPMLIACRVIQGIGSAMTFGTSMAILTSVYPLGRTGLGHRHRHRHGLFRSFPRTFSGRIFHPASGLAQPLLF